MKLNWRAPFFSWKWQAGSSLFVGITAGVIVYFVTQPLGVFKFNELASYATLMLGIASILALVASLTFGFLLYYMQSVASEKHMHYSRFKSDVMDLREFLDKLHEEGIINETYDFQMGLLEQISLKDFPILNFGERLDPLEDALIEEQKEDLEEIGEFGRVLRGFAYRVNDIEENVSGLTLTWLKSLTIEWINKSVIKCFVTLSIVIFAVIVASLYYEGLFRTICFSIGVSLALMTFLLIVEISLNIVREMKQIFPIAKDEEESDENEEISDFVDAPADVPLDTNNLFDDLTCIRGIGPATADKLYDLGITTYHQLAELSTEEAAQLGLAGVLRRYQWRKQARSMSERKSGKGVGSFFDNC